VAKLTHEQKKALDRALYMLNTVNKFVEENDAIVGHLTTIYDDAVCDASCLAVDCENAGSGLSIAFGMTEPGYE
jgi:hypothetical protein